MSLYPPNSPSPYPKKKYGRGGGHIIVNDHHEDKLHTLPDWSDNPFPAPAPAEYIADGEHKPAEPKKRSKESWSTEGVTVFNRIHQSGS